MSEVRWHTRRTCPVCGNLFYLGMAAILELTPGSGKSKPAMASSGGFSGDGEPVIALAGEGLTAGDLVTSWSDERVRKVLAPAPSVDRRARLPNPRALAKRYGSTREVARRGCPACHHPLPNAIDEGDVPSILLLGDRQSGKTALVAAIRAQRDGAYPDGLHRLILTEEARGILDEIKYEDGDTLHDRYLKGAPLERTQSGRRTPLTFIAKCRGGGTEHSLAVQINDPAGEDIVKPESRQEYVPVLQWASVLVLMVPPRGERDEDGQRLDRAGVVLGAVVESFDGVRGERWPQLIVCASKVDKERTRSNLIYRERLNSGPEDTSPYNEIFVRGLVAERDEDVVEHASTWRGKPVVWRALAAMPRRDPARTDGRAEPTWGVVKLVDDIVTALG